MTKCTCHEAGSCELHPSHEGNAHYPPEQLGKRARHVDVLKASQERDSCPESREVLRREGVFAGDKLVWLEGQHRDDIEARRASANATVTLAWPVLRGDIADARRSRETHSRGGKNSHKNVTPKITAKKYAEACASNPRNRKDLARIIGVSLQAVRDWETAERIVPWRRRKAS